VAVRSPQLHHALRSYTLGAFAYLLRELEAEDGQLPFAFEEHAVRGGPALYEYRPLVGSFIEQRAGRLALREDAHEALAALKDEPAAGMNTQEKAALRDLIRSIRQQFELTILLIEHDMGLVMDI